MAAVGGVTIPLKQLVTVVLEDADGKIKGSGKWPLVIDPSERTVTFLRQQDVNYMYLNVQDEENMEPNTIRLAVLGSLRYGKPVVLDLRDSSDAYSVAVERFQQVQDGLMASLLDKSITQEGQEAKYERLIQMSEDGDDYSVTKFSMVDQFQFIIVTSNATPPADLLKHTYPVTIE